MTNDTTMDDGTAHEPTATQQYPTGYDHVSSITEPLNELAHAGHPRYTIFDDWVTLMLTALAGDDDAYLDVANDYDRDELDKFITAFGELMHVTAEYQVDVLGDVYESFGMQSENFGQHFTPHSASESMAELQMTTQSGDDDEDSAARIMDPTCGSGRLLIAAARRFPDGHFHGIDKDGLCAKMAAVNLSLFGLTGRIAVGDTLKMDIWSVWEVQDGHPRELDIDEEEAALLFSQPEVAADD